MAIQFHCPRCNKTLRGDESVAGKRVRCPSCSTVLQIPRKLASNVANDRPGSEAERTSAALEDKGRPSWFEWLLKGLPTELRAIRRNAAERLTQLQATSSELQQIRQRADREVEHAIDGLLARRVYEQLVATTVERLSKLTQSVRVKALLRHGYRTLADLQGVSSSELEQVHGIGPASASQVVRAVNEMQTRLRSEPLNIPGPYEIGPEHTDLLRAAYRRVRSRRIPEQLVTSLTENSQQLADALERTGRAAGFFSRLFRREQAERDIGQGCRQLDALLRSGQLNQNASEARSLLDSLEAPEHFDALLADYHARIADYGSVFDRVLAQKQLVGALTLAEKTRGSHGGLPQEIADKVEALSLVVDDLNVDLRGYQEFGTKYLVVQERTILGDEMGLGKTIQAMAAMVHLKNTEDASHFLVVAPASIIGNWVREIAERTELPIRILHGSGRYSEQQRWQTHGGVAVTSYATLRSLPGLERTPIHMLVVDEAHYIKNPAAQRTQNVVRLATSSGRTVLMTGTPLENRPGEFVSLVHTCDQPLARHLGAATANRMETVVAAQKFETLVAPVYLRRNQEDVLHELPECLEVDEWVTLSDSCEAAYLNAVKERNVMAMRQAANGHDTKSAKFTRLEELLQHYRSEQQKVVIFSFFLRTLDLVGELIGEHHRIDGSVAVQRRMPLIDDFNNTRGWAAMVCQINAAGVGLNLQAASAVVLVEPQYKPTTEWQAIKRVHRMGQSRRVVVHRLLARETIDESLKELVGEKTGVFNQYARESAVKNASPAAVDISDAALTKKLVAMELERRVLVEA